MSKKMVESFSGGLTSGMMAYLSQVELSEEYDIRYVFANTGLERDETLDFVNMCDKAFGLNLTWVEAVVSPVEGEGIRHKVTNFENAYRISQFKEKEHPFHAFVRKHGIPNATFPQCSDRLKEQVIESWKKDKRLKGVPHALGMRRDEPNRVLSRKKRNLLEAAGLTPDQWRLLPKQERVAALPQGINAYDILKKHNPYNLIYPLFDMWGIDKEDVTSFWEDMPFTLNLEPHEGNCATCWKKSDKKISLLAKESPHLFEPMKWYEEQYGFVKPTDDGLPRVFFRKKRNCITMIEQAENYSVDNLRNMIGAVVEDGCSESCEAYGEML